jgi:hypothetical protein
VTDFRQPEGRLFIDGEFRDARSGVIFAEYLETKRVGLPA